MLHFTPLRTRRISVQLRELTIGESIAIAGMPAHLEQACCTAFLRYVTSPSQGIGDPAWWTVQERMLAVAHYLASTADDGPDFAIGAGRYNDYLNLDSAASDTQLTQLLELGSMAGDVWHIRHLTGGMAESIERINGDVDGVAGRLHWLLGAMAAQLVRSGESVPDALAGDVALDDFLAARMRVIAAFPESDFASLMGLYMNGRTKLNHLFNIEFSNEGIVAMPTKGGGALPPAQFPVRTCLSPVALSLV